MTWTAGACAHNGNNDDRESMWVDNNADSPFYGRMYISWNDFNRGAEIFVTHSDDGVTWSAPIQVSPDGPFIRNVQLTGSPDDRGTVFITGMDEGGGGINMRINWFYRSLDGGETWTEIQQGSPFVPPGQPLCGYFAAVPPIWRYMGWGQPGVGPGGIVHYVYAGRGAAAGDEGDIFYVRSDDNGTSWTAPIRLNTDTGNRTQWMPSLSVTLEGTVLVSWYDRRSTKDNSYEFWMIQSSDNGLSWGSDMPVSDVISPQPEQPEPIIQACYAGDYNYHSAISSNSWITWTDGRVQVSGHNQQDVFFSSVLQLQTGGAIAGTVSGGTNDPIAGARIQVMGPVTRFRSTRADGTYHLGGLPEGSYDMTVSAFGHNPGSATGIMVIDGQTTVQDFVLTPGPAHRVSGRLTDGLSGLPIPGGTVIILNTPIPPATSDANGIYVFLSIPEGTYDIQVSAPDYLQSNRTGVVIDGDVVVDFPLDATVARCADAVDIKSECDSVSGNLIANCGFETGSFPPWIRSGFPSGTRIESTFAHSGTYGLTIGPIGDLGFVAQNLATTPGGRYSLSFWLENPSGLPPHRFQVSWGGRVIFDSSELPPFPYQRYCWVGIAPTDSTELKFGFLHEPDYFHFDDVVIIPK